MKKTILLFFLFLTHQVYSQGNCQSQRYISEVFSSYTMINGDFYGSDDPYGILNNQDLYLDVYMPAGDTLANRPVIVHQYGGGYLIGWRSEPNIPDFAEMYTKRGFVFVSIDYRIGFNPLESASAERAVYRGIQDMRSSLRYLVDNASTYGIDTNHIFLTGTSAGSISAMGQTFMDDGDRPSSTFGTTLEPSDLGCSSCSGNSNFNNGEVKVHGIINNWGAVLDTSIIDIQDDALDSVPVISFHGTNDNAVMYVEGPPFSVPYFPSMQGAFLIHKRLETLNILNELHPLVGFGHEPQLLNPDLADTIVIYGSQFLYKIMQGEIDPIIGDSTVCLNDIKSYSVSNASGSTYCWNVTGGNIINQSSNSISVQWNTSGNQTIEVQEITNIEVNKTRTLNVFVQSPFIADINYSSYNGLFNFTGNFVANGNYSWDFGDSFNDNGLTVNHQYTDTGAYEVVMTINNDYCEVNDTVNIVADLCPIASFNYATNDSNLSLTNTAQFYNNVYWNFGDGTSSNNDVSTHTYLSEGTFIVQMIVYNDFCIDTLEQSVSISFCSKADFSYTTNGLSVYFNNSSFNNNASFWNFGDGNTNGTNNPNHTYASSGNYQVQLIVFDDALCSDTMVKTIFVEEKQDTVSSIYSSKLRNKINIYPNPSKKYINIVALENDKYSFEVLNLLGEKVNFAVTEQSGNQQLDLSYLEKGIYILQIRIEQDIYAYKIIKQ